MIMSFGMLLRLRVPEFAKPRSLIAGLCMCSRQHGGFVIVIVIFLCCSAGYSYAAENLECPEVGLGSVPNLIGQASGGGLFTTESRVELVNEINESINQLQISNPNISRSDMQKVLIAAYCRAVARKPGLGATEKWSRMRQFGSVLEQQIAANMMPAGTLILSPVVYRELRRQAGTSDQTAAQLMAAILTRAAGK